MRLIRGVAMFLDGERLRNLRSFIFISRENNFIDMTSTHMDESCVFLVNLHQLLVSFVPHAGLWVCSNCNEVGYTLHEGNHEDVMFKTVVVDICYGHNSISQMCYLSTKLSFLGVRWFIPVQDE